MSTGNGAPDEHSQRNNLRSKVMEYTSSEKTDKYTWHRIRPDLLGLKVFWADLLDLGRPCGGLEGILGGLVAVLGDLESAWRGLKRSGGALGRTSQGLDRS